MNYRESLDDAVVREVKEECNLDITDLRYFGSFGNTYTYCEVDYFTADAFFLCKAKDGKALALSDEVSGFVIADSAAIDMNTIAFDSIRAALKKYQALRGFRDVARKAKA